LLLPSRTRETEDFRGLDISSGSGSIEALRADAFDVLTMNIISEVILPLLPHVVFSRMADGAHLILSGILTTRRDNVVEAALANGLELVRERDKGEWWAVCSGANVCRGG